MDRAKDTAADDLGCAWAQQFGGQQSLSPILGHGHVLGVGYDTNNIWQVEGNIPGASAAGCVKDAEAQGKRIQDFFLKARAGGCLPLDGLLSRDA
jgi:hypothetical protein